MYTVYCIHYIVNIYIEAIYIYIYIYRSTAIEHLVITHESCDTSNDSL